MSRQQDYQNFLWTAQEAFGIDYGDAQTLYRDLRDLTGYTNLTVGDLVEYGDIASDLIYGPEPVPEPGWFEAGEEVEISVELKYLNVPA